MRVVRDLRQQGAAIISVLLTVALATLIVSGLFLREHVTVRSVENQIALTQTRWVERAAIDWSKVILAADVATGPLDHLGEPWAVPVEETRLDETVTAGARIDSDAQAATLSGSITDAQSRFNLNNLVTAAKSGQPPAVFPPAIEKFSKLLDLLGLSPSLADTLAARLLAAAPAGPDEQSGVGALGDVPVEVALPLIRVGDLITVRGFDAEAVQALEPFVTFLPEFTRINVNTAPAEVLASVIDDLDLGGARQQVTRRDRTPFKSVADFRLAMSPQPETLDEVWLGTGSKYFLVRGLIRFGRVESLSETLLSRTDTRRVNVIWQRRL